MPGVLTSQRVLNSVRIFEDSTVQEEAVLLIFLDGVEVARVPQTTAYAPGADSSAAVPFVQALATKVWTADVIKSDPPLDPVK